MKKSTMNKNIATAKNIINTTVIKDILTKTAMGGGLEDEEIFVLTALFGQFQDKDYVKDNNFVEDLPTEDETIYWNEDDFYVENWAITANQMGEDARLARATKRLCKVGIRHSRKMVLKDKAKAGKGGRAWGKQEKDSLATHNSRYAKVKKDKEQTKVAIEAVAELEENKAHYAALEAEYIAFMTYIVKDVTDQARIFLDDYLPSREDYRNKKNKLKEDIKEASQGFLISYQNELESIDMFNRFAQMVEEQEEAIMLTCVNTFNVLYCQKVAKLEATIAKLEEDLGNLTQRKEWVTREKVYLEQKVAAMRDTKLTLLV